jgi:1,4-dihydroxy-2-naphthoyl-CoA hydrolase
MAGMTTTGTDEAAPTPPAAAATGAITGTDAGATELIRRSMPLCATLGMRAAEAARERVVVAVDWSEGLCTTAGVLHGGVLMALADAAGATCAFLNLPEGAVGTTTLESKTNFLGAVRRGTATATARPLHAGGTTIVVETEVTDDRGRLVAKVTQTQLVLRPRA